MMPKGWRLHPVRNIAEMKSAGSFRPVIVSTAAHREKDAVITAFVEHTEGSMRSVRVRLAANGRTGRSTIAIQTAIRRAGYDVVSQFAQRAGGRLLNYLGRRISKTFLSKVVTEGIRPFEGIVAEFDPTDFDQQYHVLYEDGDEEWLPHSVLTPLLHEAPFRAADLVALDTLLTIVEGLRERVLQESDLVEIETSETSATA